MALSAMINGLKEGKFLFSIGKNLSSTLGELMSRAQKYTNAEEFFNSRKNNQATEQSSKGKRQRARHHTDKRRSNDNASRDRRLSRKPERKFHSYTPHNTFPKKILLDIRDQKLLYWPSCMKTDTGQWDKRKYCHFHRDHGRNTSNCIDLIDEIETLIRKGHLCGRDLNRAHKAHSRCIDLKHCIGLAERLRKEPNISPCSLTFTEDDARGIQHLHGNALVVAMQITNHKIYRIVVDTGSSADVLYFEAFDKMGIDRSRLRPVKFHCTGLSEIR
ncbi:uncharacterized protein LOC131249664 [Magnolia sinica]|uniref:uncharacterized protein LOC131249664 n=1 Tax=Magnolia sinica TaxID=86752 RepID=UPI00265970A2|nr:uncharacterized protein LOC131249664 [Magnolia sinica]